MYSIINPEDVDKYNNYQLCYIDDIEETILDYTPETKEYFKTPDYKKWIDKYGYSVINPRVDMKKYPNPDWIDGVSEKQAYFSKVPANKEWGDDWDDIPYEHNAGTPYGEGIILRFAFPGVWEDGVLNTYPITIKEPKDIGDGYNSLFSVEDINLGAVPWIFARENNGKANNTSVYIMSGCNPKEFLVKIELIKCLYYVQK